MNNQIKRDYEREGGPDLHYNAVPNEGLTRKDAVWLWVIAVLIIAVIIFVAIGITAGLGYDVTTLLGVK